MARKMPAQHPATSEQTVRTPEVFLRSVKSFLGIEKFYRDLAASPSNAVADLYYTKDDDGLACSWKTPKDTDWNWLNPEYKDIAPWVYCAYQCAKRAPHSNTVVLVPASTGSNWWRDWVHRKAMVLFLNGRITFNDKHGNPICSKKTGKPTPYPKDLALLLYSPQWVPGYETWTWTKECS